MEMYNYVLQQDVMLYIPQANKKILSKYLQCVCKHFSEDKQSLTLVIDFWQLIFAIMKMY